MQLIYDQLLFRVKRVIVPNNKREIKANKLNGLLTDVVDSNISLAYSPNRPYMVGCVSVYGQTFYVCINDTAGLFNAPDWEELLYIPPGVNGIGAENNDYLISENNAFLIQE